MTFPVVTEIPQTLEPVTVDSFIAALAPAPVPAALPRRRIVD